jgi:hypothetical protein
VPAWTADDSCGTSLAGAVAAPLTAKAKALGLTIPPSLLLRPDQMIDQ